jgi:hypothetical protein
MLEILGPRGMAVCLFHGDYGPADPGFSLAANPAAQRWLVDAKELRQARNLGEAQAIQRHLLRGGRSCCFWARSACAPVSAGPPLRRDVRRPAEAGPRQSLERLRARSSAIHRAMGISFWDQPCLR